MSNTTYNLGRVGLNLCGEYSPTTAYEPLDVVTWRGGSYAAKAAVTGTAPGDTSNWEALVQGVAPYDTQEQQTGNRWIDGRPIYRKVLRVPPLAASSTIYVSMGYAVAEIASIISARGYASSPSGNFLKPIPAVDTNSASYAVICDFSTADASDMRLRVITGSRVSLPQGGYVAVEYTRGADQPAY